MNLAVSQLSWAPEDETKALEILQQSGFMAIEILPTMVVGEKPYQKQEQAIAFAQEIQKQYGLSICSMQSIWYGQTGSLFSNADQLVLAEYTQQAILFAQAVGAKNLVFGSPKNRVLPEGMQDDMAVAFFKEMGNFASAHNTCFSLEANPAVYGTNYMNTTSEALAVAKRVASQGCKVNLDVGTILTNGENVDVLQGRVAEIAHVHISEPALALVKQHPEHQKLAKILRQENYNGFISIEMKPQSLADLQTTVTYVAEVFG